MVAVVLFWDLLIASAIGHKKIQKMFKLKIHLIERGAGAVLISFGVGLVFTNK